MRRIKKKYIWELVGIAVVLGVIIMGVIFAFIKPDIEFSASYVDVEINSEYNPVDFIKQMNGGTIEDVKIDDSKVDMNQLGEYKIVYKYKDKEYLLTLKVVDKQAPEYEINDIEISLGEHITPDLFVKNIKDQTEAKISFKENYEFNDVGEYQVVIVVEDLAKNKTEKQATLKVIKDDEKPTLKGLNDLTVTVGTKINYLAGIQAIDNIDKQPKIAVDSSEVNTSQLGSYNVTYTVTDQSHNKNIYHKKVNVIEKKVVNSVGQTGNKIIYLTFDDGPSSNTAKVLDILKKYNAKATFFVTGNGQKYNHLIKRAHDEGNTIGLHTYTHQYDKVYSSVDNYFNDLDKIGQMVKTEIGFVPKYIRFPGGASNTVSKKYTKGIMTILTAEVQNKGYQYYDWNASSGDAGGNNVAVSSIVRNATSSHAKNINILFHDTAAKNTTVQALPQIIEYYQALGYTFKGIDDSSFSPHQHVNN